MTNSDESARQSGRWMPALIEVAKDGRELIRQEMNLARQETIEKLTPAAQSTGMMVGGGVLVAFGGVYLLQAIVRVLATRMPLWLVSLLFGGALTAGGILLMRRGSRELKNIDIVPEKTINSLREDRQWLIDQIKSRLR